MKKIAFAAALLLLVLAAFGAMAEEPREIRAALIGTSSGYGFYDENNQLTGYNVDVANAVFERLPQYTITYEATELTSILAGIDAGIYQLAVQSLITNPQRREKYLFTEAPGKFVFKIITHSGDDSIASWKDLAGKHTEEIPGDAPIAILEAYNAQFPETPITIDYVETSALVLNHLVDRAIDFYIASGTIVQKRAEGAGVLDEIQFIDYGDDAPEYFNSNQYWGFVTSRDEAQLAQDFNDALESLIEDGTLDALNEKWFGSKDYSVTVEEARAFRDAE